VIPLRDYGVLSSVQWLQLGNSVYGFALRNLLYPDALPWQTALDLFPCIIVGGVQGIILYNLWQSLPPLYQSNDDGSTSGLCSLSSHSLFFQVCMIGVFFVSVLPALWEVITELIIVTASKIYLYQDWKDGETRFVKTDSRLARRISAVIIVLYELVIWIVVLLIGILYILTSVGAGNIVQAAVAISYINEIDNMAVIIYGDFGRHIKSQRYRCKPLLTTSFHVSFLSWLFLMPAIIVASCGVVYGLHNTYCNVSVDEKVVVDEQNGRGIGLIEIGRLARIGQEAAIARSERNGQRWSAAIHGALC